MFNKKLALVLLGFMFVFPAFGQSLTTKALTENLSNTKTLTKQTPPDDEV
jgi:hypothetical protein